MTNKPAPLRWHEFIIEAPPQQADDVAAAIAPYCYGGVSLEPALDTETGGEGYTLRTDQPTVVKGYLADDGTLDQKRAQLLEALHQRYPALVPEERQAETADWALAWRHHFQVQHIGPLVIKPSWEQYRPRPGEHVVELDPGMAFGTGDHPTTRACLRLLPKHLRSGMHVIDLGTGSGILAIAAVKLGAGAILALDTDNLAVAAARENCAANGVQQQVAVVHGSIDAPEARAFGPTELVLANLNSLLHVQLAVAVLSAVKPGGRVIASGVGAAGLRAVTAAYRSAGAAGIEVRRHGEWRSLVIKRAG